MEQPGAVWPVMPRSFPSAASSLSGSKDSSYAWLKKARLDEVLNWLAASLPRGSSQEAESRLRDLLESVEREFPDASMAVGVMRDIVAQLEATPDPRPWQETPGDLLEVTVQTCEKIGGWRSEEHAARFLARFGDAIVRLERGDSGAIGTMPLDAKRVPQTSSPE